MRERSMGEIALVPAHYGENSGIAGGAALCCSSTESGLSTENSSAKKAATT